MPGIVPSTPTRFPKGITNASPIEALGDYVAPDPTKVIQDFEDFFAYTAADWTITTVGTGTRAVSAGNGGLLLITNSAAAPDGNFYQRPAGDFLLTAGKRAFFKIRFKVDDASLAVVQGGLILTDTTPLDATDGIYFLKAAASTAIQAFVRKDATTGSTTNSNIGTLVSDTFITIGWAFDGFTKVRFFINDALVATLDGTSTYLPDTTLALSFGVQNGSAAARSMTVDYVLGAMER